MSQIIVEFSTDNAAFDLESGGNYGGEIARILHTLADHAESSLGLIPMDDTVQIKDINGNKIGTLRVITDAMQATEESAINVSIDVDLNGRGLSVGEKAHINANWDELGEYIKKGVENEQENITECALEAAVYDYDPDNTNNQ